MIIVSQTWQCPQLIDLNSGRTAPWNLCEKHCPFRMHFTPHLCSVLQLHCGSSFHAIVVFCVNVTVLFRWLSELWTTSVFCPKVTVNDFWTVIQLHFSAKSMLQSSRFTSHMCFFSYPQFRLHVVFVLVLRLQFVFCKWRQSCQLCSYVSVNFMTSELSIYTTYVFCFSHNWDFRPRAVILSHTVFVL